MGVNKTIYNLSAALAARGEDVTLFALTDKSCTVPGVTTQAFTPPRLPFKLPPDLFEAIKRLEPDVTHLHSVYTPANTRLAQFLKQHNLPYVVRPAGGLSSVSEAEVSGGKKWIYKRLFEKRMLNQALFVHSVGDTAQLKHYGVTAPICETTKGVETHDTAASKASFEATYPLAKDRLVFTFIGRLDPFHKGLDVLLDGFPDAVDCCLVLTGPSHKGSRAALVQQAARRGLTNVVFTGGLYGEDKQALLAATDVFVHTSRWEGGVPYSVLEAAAHALPALLTPEADATRKIVAADACVEVELSAEQVRLGVDRFRQMAPAERCAMGARAQSLVDARFSWAKMADEFCAHVRAHLD